MKILTELKAVAVHYFTKKLLLPIQKKNVWIVDSTKLVKSLGKALLPVEIVKFGYPQLCIKLENIGIKPTVRMRGNTPFVTDENNYIIDLKVENIVNPAELDSRLKKFAGVVETGLFFGVADTVVAGVGKKIKIFNKKKRVQTT